MPNGILEPYVFIRGRRCILAEVLFPKKVDYQNIIFSTLKTGLDEDLVRNYLAISVGNLLGEMKEYPQLFDPKHYERTKA